MVFFLSVWLHILAAAVWVGGMVFLAAILIPELRNPSVRARAPDLLHRVALRFRSVGWIALATLVATGAVNLSRLGVGWSRFTSLELWSSQWGRILAVKLALVVSVLALSATHDFFVGPRASRRLRAAPDAQDSLRLRRRASWMGRINLLLALLIVAFGVMLVRGPPW